MISNKYVKQTALFTYLLREQTYLRDCNSAIIFTHFFCKKITQISGLCKVPIPSLHLPRFELVWNEDFCPILILSKNLKQTEREFYQIFFCITKYLINFAFWLLLNNIFINLQRLQLLISLVQSTRITTDDHKTSKNAKGQNYF